MYQLYLAFRLDQNSTDQYVFTLYQRTVPERLEPFYHGSVNAVLVQFKCTSLINPLLNHMPTGF